MSFIKEVMNIYSVKINQYCGKYKDKCNTVLGMGKTKLTDQ